MTIVWPGVKGETFTNDTGKILYQLVCSLVNTCGVCFQYHLSIASWWSPFHRGCQCMSVPIYPDKKSAPYEDFQEIIDSLPPDQQKKVVGSSNLKLIEAKVIDWGDVITSNRVKLLREIVSIKKLSISDLTGAGISKRIADDVWATVNTEAHVIADRQRTQLLKQIQDLGIQPGHLKDIFGDIMAQRIGIGGGPSGINVIPPTRTDQQWIEALMKSFGTGGMGGPSPTPGPAPRPKPTPESKPEPQPQPKPMPQTIEDFAREVTVTINSVPLELRYADTKVWIIDAFAEFKKTYPDATIEQFKQDLVEANIARLVTLARFDVPGQLSKELRKKDDDSETKQGIATFNQIRIQPPGLLHR